MTEAAKGIMEILCEQNVKDYQAQEEACVTSRSIIDSVITVRAYHCNRCGYIWPPKDFDDIWAKEALYQNKHKSCARCNSNVWDHSKRRKVVSINALKLFPNDESRMKYLAGRLFLKCKGDVTKLKEFEAKCLSRSGSVEQYFTFIKRKGV